MTSLSMRYHGDWSKWSDMRDTFFYPPEAAVTASFPTDGEVLFAVNREDGYEGACVVFWARNGKFYEARFGHCSCNAYSDYVAEFDTATAINAEYLHSKHPSYPIEISGAEGVAWDVLCERVASTSSAT